MRRFWGFVAALVAVASIGAIAYVALTRGAQQSDDAEPSGSSTASVTADPAPVVSPSPEEITSPAASAEPATPSEEPSPAPDPAGSTLAPTDHRQTADVTISFLEWDAGAQAVEAAGYVARLDSGGTCTLTLTHVGTAVAMNVAGVQDVSTVVCGGFTVPRAKLTAGPWTATLRYESTTQVGVSAPVLVTVP